MDPSADPLPKLLLVCGAFGSGKSTLAPLVARLVPECLVLDVDWLLPSLSALTGRNLRESAESWPRLREVWLAIAEASNQAGRPTVLFTPTSPTEIVTDGRFSTHWLALDCADEEISSRLARRTGWTPEATSEALIDAASLRGLGMPVIRTDTSIELSARRIADWIRSWL